MSHHHPTPLYPQYNIMNRRTLLATTPFALVPRLSSRTSSDTEEPVTDPPSLKDLLPGADKLPAGWIPGSPKSPPVGRRDEGPPSTVWGVRSRRHPRNDQSLSPRFAERRFVTESELPAEFGHLDVALEVARIDEETAHDSRSQAVEALHEITLAEQTQNWELMTTGWADHGIIPTDDWLRDQSAASLRKPQCAVPNDVELSTDKPMIEMAIAIEPLSWGTVVVTGTLVDPDDTNRPSRLASKIASQVADTIHGQPLPVEARQ